MKNLLIVILFYSSTIQAQQVCKFGEMNFNKKTYNERGVVPTGKITNASNVICIDFDGGMINNPYWGNITYMGANLTTSQMNEVLLNVSEKYSPFDVDITTSDSVYNLYPLTKRTKLIITETWQWNGTPSGGVAFVNSMSWGNDTPCWVFSSLLNYNVKLIKEASTHEIGHTLNLYHQSVYDANCQFLSEYNYGGNGVAPIMGVSYYQPVSQWWVGPTPNGCTNLQNDFSVLQGILGLRLTTLAIDFITFKVENNAAFWEVSDINSIQYFIVEKSDDGINFYQIGKVPINNQRKYSYLW